MSQDDIRTMAGTLRTRIANDPQFKARVLQDPQGTLRAEGYPDPIISAVAGEVAQDGSADEVSGYMCVVSALGLAQTYGCGQR